MGQHRSGDAARGISRGVIIAVIAMLVVALGIVGWRALSDVASGQGNRAAAQCVEGNTTVDVLADDSITGTLAELAAGFTPVVRDHCVTVAVHAADSAAVVTALAANNPASLGAPPALWVPATSTAIAAVRAANPKILPGNALSIAASPVVLATAGPVPNPPAWADISVGTMTLALPPGDVSRIAAISIANGVARSDLSDEAARSSAVASAIMSLAARAVKNPPKTADAITMLSSPNPAFTAVPVTEAQLRQAHSMLTPVRPSGPQIIADYPAAPLQGPWLREEQIVAAAQFAEYLQQPPQQKVLTGAGFQLAHLDTSPIGAGVFSAVSGYLTAAKAANASIVALDVSGSMGTAEGTRSRLQNVASALKSTFAAMPDDAKIGLWEYSNSLSTTPQGSALPYRVDVPLGRINRTALGAALDGAQDRTATATYTTVLAAYRTLVADYTPGQPNSILLITDGPNDDTALSSAAFLAAVKAAANPVTPVRVDVISLGANSDEATLRALADSTGGTYFPVANTTSADLATSLKTTLGAQ